MRIKEKVLWNFKELNLNCPLFNPKIMLTINSNVILTTIILSSSFSTHYWEKGLMAWVNHQRQFLSHTLTCINIDVRFRPLISGHYRNYHTNFTMHWLNGSVVKSRKWLYEICTDSFVTCLRKSHPKIEHDF